MKFSAEQLYALVPAVYRTRDAGADGAGALRGLLEVLAREGRLVEDDIGRLYDDWFIETCAEWVVPYIAELLGVRGLRELGEGVPISRRALVANTVAYRRRKGTLAVLEQLAFDTTGWRAKGVEFFQRLATTQHMNHVRAASAGWASLASADALEGVGTPFDTQPYSADVRHIESGRGRHDIPHIGLFVWRLGAYRMLVAEPAPGPAPGSWFLNPLAQDLPLFNPPHTESDIGSITGEVNVPAPLRRRPLYDELEARRQALVDGREPLRRWFDERPAGGGQAFEVWLDGVALPPAELLLCDLSDWHVPPNQLSYLRATAGGAPVPVDLPISAAVDPLRGRLVLAPARAAARVRASFSQGGAGDLGGGPYSRTASLAEALAWRVGPDAEPRAPDWQIGVSRVRPPLAGQVVAKLAEAVAAWNLRPAGSSFGVITLLDSSSWAEDLSGATRLRVPAGSRLVVAAADGVRAHLRGAVDVVGTAAAGDEAAGEAWFDGLLLEGDLRVLDGNLKRLRLAHCTVVPGRGRVRVTSGNPDLRIELVRCISGAIEVPPPIEGLSLRDCIVQAVGGPTTAIDLDASALDATACTVLGRTTVQSVEASDCLFAGRLTVARAQQGCVRFCYLADGSTAPRRYRCQPDLALGDAGGSAAAAVRARLRPTFTSTRHGDPGYGQLAGGCAAELALGAEDGTEMGALNFVKQAHRMANLHSQLEHYLRFGLEAGVVFVT